LNPYFTINNEYLALYRKDEGDFATKTVKIDAANEEVFYKSLPFKQETKNEYCPKCKKDKSFCPHKM